MAWYAKFKSHIRLGSEISAASYEKKAKDRCFKCSIKTSSDYNFIISVLINWYSNLNDQVVF